MILVSLVYLLLWGQPSVAVLDGKKDATMGEGWGHIVGWGGR